jgi:hypothetical protein
MPEKPVRRRRARQPEGSAKTAKPRKQPGLRYKQPHLVGKHLFRVREVHVRDHLVPLLSKNRLGAAKLDLILRGLALSPQHRGKRSTPGLVLNTFTYEDLHDLARAPNWFGGKSGDTYAYDAGLARLKRKWVGEQLQALEAMRLIRREPRPGDHPTIVVLRDDGSGKAFDDPDGTPGKTYVSILGGIISSGALAEWSMAQLTFYLAAMIAERHTIRLPVQLPPNILELVPNLAVRGTEPGSGRWYRPLTWFNDATQREDNAVLIPFSTSTLERGLKAFEADGLIEVRKLRRNPRTNKPFKSGPRNLYINKFGTLTEAARIVPAEQFDAELQQLVTQQSQQR